MKMDPFSFLIFLTKYIDKYIKSYALLSTRIDNKPIVYRCFFWEVSPYEQCK